MSDKDNNLQEKSLISKQEIVFPEEWYVSISFGKSSSRNFPQAVALAKMAPQYIENDVEGNIIYQAVYSSKPSEYLQFIKLYELIKDWKSCFVVINGELVDRKIIGGINYCYGDKCRSGNPNFCYGASYMTENPFGCHRIQISACNNPWWSFGRFDSKGIWHVDKEAMLKRIAEYSEPYRLCPVFSLQRVLDGLKKLPDTIDPATNRNWMNAGTTITPRSNPNTITYTIKIEPPDIKEGAKHNPGCGCFSTIVLVFFVVLSIILIID
jgi:hypothetical protein